MRRGRSRRSSKAGAALLAAAVALAGCGGTTTRTSRTTAVKLPNFVDIYSSLPAVGPEATQGRAIEQGIQLALTEAHMRAGAFTIQYRRLDDADGDGWSAALTANNARAAARDPNAVYYIGEFDSKASEISMPILNEAGIAQVSPANGYVGLTESIANVTPDTEPGQYRPAHRLTYMRIIPNDAVQAAADLAALGEEHCARVAIAYDKQADGAELSALIALTSESYRIRIVGRTLLQSLSANLHAYELAIQRQHADCLILAGGVSTAAIAATDFVQSHLEAPAKVIGTDGMCTAAWTTDAAPAQLSRYLECTEPTLPLDRYRLASQFLAAFHASGGHGTPSAYAIYGYEAMELGLETIQRLGAAGDNRAAVLRALLATRDRESPIGTYSFDPDGDTTLRGYGLYRIVGGIPRFERTLTPPNIL